MIEWDVLKKIFPKIVVAIFGLMILLVSVTRAGIDLLAKDNNMDQLKNREISFLATLDDGTKETVVYKLPQAGMAGDNILYGFKTIRNYLWLVLSKKMDRPRIALLLADKKIVEFESLSIDNKNVKAIEAGNEALDNLEYADSLTRDLGSDLGGKKQLRQQIFLAGLAYKESVSLQKDNYSLDNESYIQLINRLDDWNKKTEKNRFSWDY